MNEYYFDACSLIYLTKIGMKEQLPKLEITPRVSPIVESELVAKLDKLPDAKQLKSNIEKGIINKSTLKD